MERSFEMVGDFHFASLHLQKTVSEKNGIGQFLADLRVETREKGLVLNHVLYQLHKKRIRFNLFFQFTKVLGKIKARAVSSIFLLQFVLTLII